MLFIDRLENFLNEKKITKTELAEKIGIRRPTISEWKKNGAIPSGDICLKIANYLNVSVEWLLTGEEKQAPQLSQEEEQFIGTYQNLTEEQKKTIRILLDGYKNENTELLKKVSE